MSKKENEVQDQRTDHPERHPSWQANRRYSEQTTEEALEEGYKSRNRERQTWQPKAPQEET